MRGDDEPVMRFGVFEADLRTGELRRQGGLVRLQSQPFLLLRVLLERAGDLVTRNELRLAIWPDSLFVDFELGLNRAVSKLRRALGDAAGNPRFIETLPRRGYRFMAPVLDRHGGAQPSAAEGLPSCYLTWTGREAALREGANVIGRAEDAAVRIDADTVSRHHARIHVRGKKALLEDLGSKNGTFLGGRLVKGTEPIASGAEIWFGSFPVVFRVASASRSTRTARRA